MMLSAVEYAADRVIPSPSPPASRGEERGIRTFLFATAKHECRSLVALLLGMTHRFG
jgi:hypothetical protein